MTLPQNNPIIIAETGDVLFTLRNPGAAFAVWDPDEEESEGDVDEERDKEQNAPSNDASSNDAPSHDAPSNDAPPDNAPPNDALNDATVDTLKDDSNRPAQSEATQPAVVYKCSSQHLISASPKFKSELTSWNESHKREDGLYYVNADDWDQEALTILLNVLHLRFRQVPRSPSLELLAKIAGLVDYYRCWEAFDLIADVWTTEVRKTHPVPMEYGRELMLWMLISWVFKLDTEFSSTTLRSLQQCDEANIRDMELGIPPAILKTLETQRSNLLQEAISVCHGWIEKFCGAYSCVLDNDQSFNCGSMLLGALTKQMHNMGILSPRTVRPFSGLSLEELQHRIKSMRMPTWYVKYPDTYVQHSCSLDSIVREVSSIIGQAKGLELNNFVDRAESTTNTASCPS